LARWSSGCGHRALRHEAHPTKDFLGHESVPAAEFGAKVVVGCPPGEEHDIAAFAVAYRCRVRGCRVHYLGANVPVVSLAKLCEEVEPDLTIMSFPVALSEANATALVQGLADEVRPASDLVVGGHGALAMRDLFPRYNIMVLENFAELDHRLDQLMGQTVSRG
jgi:methanogenic corrinoid protein MtbC1